MLVFLVVLFRASSVKLFTLHPPLCSLYIGAALLFFFSMGLAAIPSETYRALGRIPDFSGGVARAMSELRRVIELEPHSAELHDDLGTVVVQESDGQSAAAEFSEELRRQLNYSLALLHLG